MKQKSSAFMKITDKENNKELYQCPECGFHYREKEWMEK